MLAGPVSLERDGIVPKGSVLEKLVCYAPRIELPHCLRCFVHNLMKPSLSLVLSPTLLTFPSRARASATLYKSFVSARLLLSPSSDSNNVSVLLAVSSDCVVL